MRSSEKRHQFIEYLNYLTYHEHKTLFPINSIINSFKSKTNIEIPQSTAYRIVKKYIIQQNILLDSQIDDKILKIYNG